MKFNYVVSYRGRIQSTHRTKRAADKKADSVDKSMGETITKVHKIRVK